MLTDELEHRIGVSQSLSSVQSKEAERQELQRKTEEFIAKGGKIRKAKPSEWNPESTSFNREGPINPAKRQKGWDNHGIAKNYKTV